MNITYMIGNGFDLAVGLETKYSDFYKYLEARKDFLEKYPFMNKIEKSELWKDLEIGIGAITIEFEKYNNPVEEYSNFHDDLSNELVEYIKKENDKIKQIPDDISNYFKISFMQIKNMLKPAEQNIIPNYNIDEQYVYRFITFNYTDVLTKCLKKIIISHTNSRHNNNIPDSIIMPIHIHSNLSHDIPALIGVNDKTQILSEKLRDILEDVCVKSVMNEIIGELVIEKVNDIIKSSKVICIFGHSLGETDKIWWNKIAEWLLTSTSNILILFAYVENQDMDKPHKIVKLKKQLKDNFIKHTKLTTENNLELIDKQIFVIYKNSIIDVKLTEFQNENTDKEEDKKIIAVV